MGVFNRMRVASRAFKDELKRSRKNERDNICDGLQALGIDAQIVEHDQPEEDIGIGVSLGLIDILESPISWVNVRKVHHSEGATDYYIDYGIPDSKLEHNFQQKGGSRGFFSRMQTASGVFLKELRGGGFGKLKIKSVRKKALPLFGKVVDMYWQGKDFGLGIIDRLNGDILLKRPIMKSYDVKIRTHSDHGCWIISTETRNPPSEELWNCYQSIAKHLLAEWPSRPPKS